MLLHTSVDKGEELELRTHIHVLKLLCRDKGVGGVDLGRLIIILQTVILGCLCADN